MNWQEIFRIRLTDSWGIRVTLGPVLLVVLVIVGLYLVVRFIVMKKWLRFEIVEAEVKLGNIGSIKIRPTYEEIQIAHKAWTELVTRKAAVLFDDQNDVIAEVYNSWY